METFLCARSHSPRRWSRPVRVRSTIPEYLRSPIVDFEAAKSLRVLPLTRHVLRVFCTCRLAERRNNYPRWKSSFCLFHLAFRSRLRRTSDVVARTKRYYIYSASSDLPVYEFTIGRDRKIPRVTVPEIRKRRCLPLYSPRDAPGSVKRKGY